MRPLLSSVILHHSLEPAWPCQTLGACACTMRDMQCFHQDTRAWDNIAYRSLSPPRVMATTAGPAPPLGMVVEPLWGLSPPLVPVTFHGPCRPLWFLLSPSAPVTHHSPCGGLSHSLWGWSLYSIGSCHPHSPYHPSGSCHCTPVGTVVSTGSCQPQWGRSLSPHGPCQPVWLLSSPVVATTVPLSSPPLSPHGSHHCPTAVPTIVSSLSSHGLHHCPPTAPPLSPCSPHQCPFMIPTTVPSKSPSLFPQCPHTVPIIPHSPIHCPYIVPTTVPLQSPSLSLCSPHHFPP